MAILIYHIYLTLCCWGGFAAQQLVKLAALHMNYRDLLSKSLQCDGQPRVNSP